MQDRRAHTVRGTVRRWIWPAPLALVIGQRLAPLAAAVAMWSYVAFGTTPRLFGVFDTDIVVTACGALTIVGSVWLPLRPVIWLSVTIGTLGLSMTLLWQGTPTTDQRDTEILKAILFFTLWVSYLSCHLLTEFVRAVRTRGQAGG